MLQNSVKSHLNIDPKQYSEFQDPSSSGSLDIETRLTVEKLPKDHNSGKNQSSMTSVKYDHLQVMETITGKFHQNPLRNVGGVTETRISTDKRLNLTKGHYSGKNSQA